MMKALFPPALLLAAAAALAGCESSVNLPEPPHTPRVALIYTLTTAPQDSSFQELFNIRQLYVSNSQRVFSQAELPGRADAAVELRNAAGTVVERYRPLAQNPNNPYQGGSGNYRPVLGFRPQPGQAYTLRATLPGLAPAESTLTLPLPATVESGTYVPRPPDANNPNPYAQAGRLTLTVRDDPNAANYYLAFARVLDAQGRGGDWSAVELDYNSQSNTASIEQFQLSSPQQQYSLYPYADTNLNGQRITLNSDVSFSCRCYGTGTPPVPGYIEVHVSSLTKDAYEFYLSRRRYYDSDGNPFAEPAPLASNLKNGYGLFAGATDVTYRIRL